MNLICCVNEPCHFHRANRQREWKKCFGSMSIDCFWWCNPKHREQCVDTFLSETHRIRDILIFFRFFSLRPIYVWAEQTCFSFTHTRQNVNLFSLYKITEEKMCVHHTHSKCCVTLYKSKSSKCYTTIETSKLVEYRNWIMVKLREL